MNLLNLKSMKKYMVTVYFGNNSATYEIEGFLNINSDYFYFTKNGENIGIFPIKKTSIIQYYN
jgi:hypothetical protein